VSDVVEKIKAALDAAPPTDAEVRACKISLGAEAIADIRRAMTCPLCGVIHNDEAATSIRLVEEGFEALREAALAWKAKIPK
jgi:hypothetical protein